MKFSFSNLFILLFAFYSPQFTTNHIENIHESHCCSISETREIAPRPEPTTKIVIKIYLEIQFPPREKSFKMISVNDRMIAVNASESHYIVPFFLWL